MVLALRVGRVFVFEWLCFDTRRRAVLLLVDLTPGASLFGFGALPTAFLVEVTSLLATSALASAVLGLAMQDTLASLRGVSRYSSTGRFVSEIRRGAVGFRQDQRQVVLVSFSWRATLVLFAHRGVVTIPNKTVAQGTTSPLSNFSGRERPSFVPSSAYCSTHTSTWSKRRCSSRFDPVEGDFDRSCRCLS